MNREYNFFTYNCRHFVLDLLQVIVYSGNESQVKKGRLEKFNEDIDEDCPEEIDD